MKVIEPSVEILKQEDFSIKGIKRFIEQCARLSYKSEDRITEDSYEKFVQMLIDKDHARPLEFGTVHLKMNFNHFDDFIANLSYAGSLNCLWIKWNFNSMNSMYYITTNYRYYTEVCLRDSPYLAEHCFTEEDSEFYPKRYAAKFIISRGIMDEFRTHISLSSIAESTRYCNYSKGKFGNEITCVIPCYCSDLIEGNSYDLSICEYGLIQAENLSEKSAKWVESMCQAEQDYMDLLNNGCTAQEARDVLPLGIKSELILCGFKDAWDNFFYRRCAVDAHPDARYIAEQLKSKIYE